MEPCSVGVLADDGCWCSTVAAGEPCKLYRSGIGGGEEFAGWFGWDGLGCVFESHGGEPVMTSESSAY